MLRSNRLLLGKATVVAIGNVEVGRPAGPDEVDQLLPFRIGPGRRVEADLVLSGRCSGEAAQRRTGQSRIPSNMSASEGRLISVLWLTISVRH